MCLVQNELTYLPLNIPPVYNNRHPTTLLGTSLPYDGSHHKVSSSFYLDHPNEESLVTKRSSLLKQGIPWKPLQTSTKNQQCCPPPTPTTRTLDRPSPIPTTVCQT